MLYSFLQREVAIKQGMGGKDYEPSEGFTQLTPTLKHIGPRPPWNTPPPHPLPWQSDAQTYLVPTDLTQSQPPQVLLQHRHLESSLESFNLSNLARLAQRGLERQQLFISWIDNGRPFRGSSGRKMKKLLIQLEAHFFRSGQQPPERTKTRKYCNGHSWQHILFRRY